MLSNCFVCTCDGNACVDEVHVCFVFLHVYMFMGLCARIRGEHACVRLRMCLNHNENCFWTVFGYRKIKEALLYSPNVEHMCITSHFANNCF